MRAQTTQCAADIANGVGWIAEQIMETCQDVYDGSYAPGSFVIGGDEYCVEVVISEHGTITRWSTI